MVYGVKRRGQVKKRSSADVTFIYTDDHIIIDYEDGSLGRVLLTVGDWTGDEETISVSVLGDSGINDTLNELWNEAEIGYKLVWKNISRMGPRKPSLQGERRLTYDHYEICIAWGVFYLRRYSQATT